MPRTTGRQDQRWQDDRRPPQALGRWRGEPGLDGADDGVIRRHVVVDFRHPPILSASAVGT